MKTWFLCGPCGGLDVPSGPCLLPPLSGQPQPCHTLSHRHVFAHAIPSAQSAFPTPSTPAKQTLLQPSGPGSEDWVPEAVRSSHRQALSYLGYLSSPLGWPPEHRHWSFHNPKPVSSTQLVLSAYPLNERGRDGLRIRGEPSRWEGEVCVLSQSVCLEELAGAGGGDRQGWFLGENVTEKRPVGTEPGRECRTM